MNAGCYGDETKDVLVEAYAIAAMMGRGLTLSNAPGWTSSIASPRSGCAA